jgi:hypothetical protein
LGGGLFGPGRFRLRPGRRFGSRGFLVGGFHDGRGPFDHGQEDFLAGAQGVRVRDRRVEFQEEVQVLAEDELGGHALGLEDLDQGVAALHDVGLFFVGVGRYVSRRARRGRRRRGHALGDADDLPGAQTVEVGDVRVHGADLGHHPLDLGAGQAFFGQDLEQPFVLPHRVLVPRLGLGVEVLLKKETQRFF